MITEKIYSDIVTAKLRGAYEKVSFFNVILASHFLFETVGVFVAIHDLDHFTLDVDICPRCKKTKDGMKIKVFCDPCRFIARLLPFNPDFSENRLVVTDAIKKDAK